MKKILETLKRKWAEYLLEMIVITMGILGAYTLNNWNEGRKNSILQKAHLKNIHQEFKTNKIQFERILQSFEIRYERADSIVDMLPITNENWNQINDIYGAAYRSSSFDPSNSSIEVLINSGKIDLVKSDSLKSLILSWNDQFEDYKEEENDLQNLKVIYDDIYLNEPGWIRKRGVTAPPISDELKIKLEKLIRFRLTDLSLVLSKWRANQESKDLMLSIDAIISLSEPYSD